MSIDSEQSLQQAVFDAWYTSLEGYDALSIQMWKALCNVRDRAVEVKS